MEALGRHILAEFFQCDSEILNDTSKIEKLMCDAAEKCGATIVESVFHTFNPFGVSGVVVTSFSPVTRNIPKDGFKYPKVGGQVFFSAR